MAKQTRVFVVMVTAESTSDEIDEDIRKWVDDLNRNNPGVNQTTFSEFMLGSNRTPETQAPPGIYKKAENYP